VVVIKLTTTCGLVKAGGVVNGIILFRVSQ